MKTIEQINLLLSWIDWFDGKIKLKCCYEKAQDKNCRFYIENDESEVYYKFSLKKTEELKGANALLCYWANTTLSENQYLDYNTGIKKELNDLNLAKQKDRDKIEL